MVRIISSVKKQHHRKGDERQEGFRLEIKRRRDNAEMEMRRKREWGWNQKTDEPAWWKQGLEREYNSMRTKGLEYCDRVETGHSTEQILMEYCVEVWIRLKLADEPHQVSGQCLEGKHLTLQKPLSSTVFSEIFVIEFGRHWTPHLHDIGNASLLGK